MKDCFSQHLFFLNRIRRPLQRRLCRGTASLRALACPDPERPPVDVALNNSVSKAWTSEETTSHGRALILLKTEDTPACAPSAESYQSLIELYKCIYIYMWGGPLRMI